MGWCAKSYRVAKKNEFYQINHLKILLPVGKKYLNDIRGKSANGQFGKTLFFRHPVLTCQSLVAFEVSSNSRLGC